jgi:hypothetical protein
MVVVGSLDVVFGTPQSLALSSNVVVRQLQKRLGATP